MQVRNMFDDTPLTTVDDLSSFHVELRPHGGMALLVCRAAEGAAGRSS
jgi:hypothetical protein